MIGDFKHCTEGDPCGRTCISKSDTCRIGLGTSSSEAVGKFSAIAKRRKKTIEWESKPFNKKGGYGSIYRSRDGKWVKKVLKDGSKLDDYEVKLTEKYIPGSKASLNREALAMPFIGTKSIGDREREKTLDEISGEKVEKFLDEVTGLHKDGHIHGDLHKDNMLVDDITGEIKMIDFGLSREKDDFYDDPEDTFRDLSFIPTTLLKKLKDSKYRELANLIHNYQLTDEKINDWDADYTDEETNRFYEIKRKISEKYEEILHTL